MLPTQQGQRNLTGKLPVYIQNFRYFLFYSRKVDKKARKKKKKKSLQFLHSKKGCFFLPLITENYIPLAPSSWNYVMYISGLCISNRPISYWHLTHYSKSHICIYSNFKKKVLTLWTICNAIYLYDRLKNFRSINLHSKFLHIYN